MGVVRNGKIVTRTPSSEDHAPDREALLAPSPRRPVRVLLVDDDGLVLGIAGRALEEAGYEVLTAGSAEEGLEIVSRSGVPDLAVLDIRLPRRSGLDLGRTLRKTSDLPIVMLTSVDDQAIVVEAIQGFADDYVRKPFDPNELAARVARILGRRRTRGTRAGYGDGILELGDVTLDLPRRRVRRGGTWISLTPTEGKILEALLLNRGHIVTSTRLLEQVWPDGDVFEDALRVNVHRLRRKIETDPAKPKYLRTERGLGYLFQSAPSTVSTSR